MRCLVNKSATATSTSKTKQFSALFILLHKLYPCVSDTKALSFSPTELGSSITGVRCYPETKEHGVRGANKKLEVGPSRDRVSLLKQSLPSLHGGLVPNTMKGWLSPSGNTVRTELGRNGWNGSSKLGRASALHCRSHPQVKAAGWGGGW